jgi:quercetin dioxygenase-like cupin family protein
MEIKRVGSQASAKGPSEWFTGTVRIDPLFQAPDPALVSGASVTFEPGARTAWHTPPLGQTFIVTAGSSNPGVRPKPQERRTGHLTRIPQELLPRRGKPQATCSNLAFHGFLAGIENRHPPSTCV